MRAFSLLATAALVAAAAATPSMGAGGVRGAGHASPDGGIAGAAARSLAVGPGGVPIPDRLTLYIEGVFDNSYPRAQMVADAVEVSKSGFTTAVLAFLHVHKGACAASQPGWPDFVYNNVCFAAADALPDVLAALRGPGSSIQRVIVSIGGAGCSSDYDALGGAWPVYSKQLAAFIAHYGLDGIDLDLEDDLGPYMTVLQDLVTSAASANLTVTAAPAGEDEGWLTLVKATAGARADGGPGMSWMHLQTYGGAGDWVTRWAAELAGVVPAPAAAFLLPGGSAAQGFTFADMADLVKSTRAGAPIAGAFVWDYRMIKYFAGGGRNGNVTVWAEAINKALGAA
jgi:hypothetical protein